MTVTAATRKGSGRTNQDRYISGHNFAAVLDGASSFTEEQAQHDGGWYAETLGAKLRELLTAQPASPLPEIVARAIESLVGDHELRPDTSPSSTIALVRWDDHRVETYVLGDSTVAILHPDGSGEVYSDDRLASIGVGLRRAYRERLAAGKGFDDQHRQLLGSLHREQAKWRNREDGYWIAGADPKAAWQATVAEHVRKSVASIVLATDGVTSIVGEDGILGLPARSGAAPNAFLTTLEEREISDASGRRWPRSKPHDDKTLTIVRFVPAQATRLVPPGYVTEE